MDLVERENEDDAEEPARRTMAAGEGHRTSRQTKMKQVPASAAKPQAPAKPKSVSFRRAGAEVKDLVVTNQMLSSHGHHEEVVVAAPVHKYGVSAVNERALGKVVFQYVM